MVALDQLQPLEILFADHRNQMLFLRAASAPGEPPHLLA